MPRTFLLLILIALLPPPGVRGEIADAGLAQADAAIQAATPRAQADPLHPIFHVTSPAQWINDPNGPIFYGGYYHLFYQLYPFSDGSGPKYWGHARSRDLATWETLPTALRPSTEADEAEVWSGCCTINGEGKPMIFYTSIAPGKNPMDHSEQWAATSDDDLIVWHKSPANPVLTEELHGGTKIYDWRDPFVFHDAGLTYLVAGGNLNRAQGGQAVVNIYEAQNAGLTQWKYRGILFEATDPAAKTAECPNFFQLGNRWVLFLSPYGKVQYFVGDFDAATCRFKPQTHGVLDGGQNFYAPNTMLVPEGRRLVWGWVNGFPGGRGWNGCLSLPRLLSLSPDGQLQQEPAPQLTKLRGRPVERRHVRLDTAGETFPLPKTNTLEIRAEIDLQAAKSVALEFQSGSFASPPLVVAYDGADLAVLDVKTPLTLPKNGHTLSLRIFIDRSVLEVFANGIVCVTKVIAPLDASPTLKIRALAGSASAKVVEAWPMKSIWATPASGRTEVKSTDL